ncbi:hypothetical protein P8605_37095 [Streptomyces sp. T-3]|nr:hypothetical protein [Streptomyces sp. T-3]
MLGRANDWLARHPWGLACYVRAVTLGAVRALDPDRSVLGWLLSSTWYATVTACFLLILQRSRKRALGVGRRDLRRLEQALWRGELPESQPDRRALRRLIEQTLRRQRHLVWILPAFAATVFGVSVLALATGQMSSGLTLGCLGLVLCTWFGYSALHVRRNAHRLAGQLDTGPEKTAAGPRAPQGEAESGR